MVNALRHSADEQDPSLAFLNRLLDRLQNDQRLWSDLSDCISRGDSGGFFDLLEQGELVGDACWDLDDDWLDEIAGGRGALPLALVLLAGSLGSGHGLRGLPLPQLGASLSPATGSGWQQYALPLIRAFEGLALEAYSDPVGIATIGYGTTRYPGGQPVQLGDRISAERAEQLLAHSLDEHYGPAVMAAIPEARFYSPQQQAALISFTYNVGVGALRNSSLRRRLRHGEDPQAVIAEELPRWCRGGGRELQGLVRRRAAEVALFRLGRYG